MPERELQFRFPEVIDTKTYGAFLKYQPERVAKQRVRGDENGSVFFEDDAGSAALLVAT